MIPGADGRGELMIDGRTGRVAGLLAGLAVACGARADMVSALAPSAVVAPASLGFSNSTTAGTLTSVGTLATAPYNFLDQWTFTLAGSADVAGFVGTLNFVDALDASHTTQGIDNLQLRLRGPGGNLVSWTTASSLFPVGGAVQVFEVAAPTALLPGSYTLEIRGTLVGPSAAYAGTLQAIAPVPLPAALPLLALGLAGLGLRARRRLQ